MQVTLTCIPDTKESFTHLQEKLYGEPWGAAVVMVAALLVYSRNAELGLNCLAQAVDAASLQAGKLHPNTVRRLALQIGAQPYLPQAYIQGTSPANAYSLPAAPFSIRIETNPYSGDPQTGPLKVFVACEGASKPRPVTVVRSHDGFWKAKEWSSLVMGIVPAAG